MRQVDTSFLRSGNIEHIEVFAHILLRKRGKEEIYDVLSISVNQNKNSREHAGSAIHPELKSLCVTML